MRTEQIIKSGPETTEIEFRDCGLRFGDRWIFRHLNLAIKKAENFVIIGPSGHGKSALLKLMAGLIAPTEGEVLIRGVNLQTAEHQKRQELLLRMGMLFQKNALFDFLNVQDNVAFPLREVTSKPEDEIQKTVGYFLGAVGLSHAALLSPSEISGGMQKRLGIARALALSPEIIFYDDPTAGLDPITSRKIIDLIFDLQKKNQMTAISVTNDMNRAYQMGDRIAMIADGELIISGSPAETKTHADPRIHHFIRGQMGPARPH